MEVLVLIAIGLAVVLGLTLARRGRGRSSSASDPFGAAPTGGPGAEALARAVQSAHLAELHRAGALTDAEFEAAKRRVLDDP